MAQTLSFSPLSLDLPSSRMSIDFSSFGPHPSKNPDPHTDKLTRRLLQHNAVQQRPFTHGVSAIHSSRSLQYSRPSAHNPQASASSREVHSRAISRASSNASTASSASTASTAPSSTFSHSPSLTTTIHSASHSSYTRTLDVSHRHTYESLSLSMLPLSLLEQILSYTLCLPLTVSIGPQNAENHHMQYRYNRAGLEYIDIQLILKHPIFIASRRLREAALEVFYQKCDFVVDLHRIYHTRVSSTVNDNLKKHQKFWIHNPPKMVRDSLRSISRLHLRLPVPSCDSLSHRGRLEDDWMDGSDGKGGGAWKIKSLRKERDDAAGIQACVEAVMGLVSASPQPEPELRGRSPSVGRMGSLRRRSLSRLRSKSRSRSRSRGRQALNQSSSGQNDHFSGSKRPLKRMEIVLVKRNGDVTVLPEILGLVKTLRSTPVTGFTKYYFELEEQKIVWATRYRKRWQGFEPDGERLLADLHAFSTTPRPIDPISTPTKFSFVGVSKRGKLQLSDSALLGTPITLEPKQISYQPAKINDETARSSKATHRKPSLWGWKKGHKDRDSFALVLDEGVEKLGSSGTSTSGRVGPPTVDELKKIAEDIKNGLY